MRELEKHFEGIIMVIFLSILTVLVLAQIVMRYFFEDPMTWSEELCRTLLVWSGFVSIGFCVRKGSTICLDACQKLLPFPYRRILLNFVSIFMIVLLSYLFYGSILLVADTIAIGADMAGMQIPQYWLYLIPMISIALAVLRYIQVMIMTKFYANLGE